MPETCGQLKLTDLLVIAIDNHPIRLRLARHNALQLGVADRIEFVLGDFVTYAKSLVERGISEEIDVVFLSPPWGMFCSTFVKHEIKVDRE
jgi:23S rRNA G2445 N2-methylase RlmL